MPGSYISDRLGQRYGRLTVVASAPFRGPSGSAAWLVRCDCGEEEIRDRNSLDSSRKNQTDARCASCLPGPSPAATAPGAQHGTCTWCKREANRPKTPYECAACNRRATRNGRDEVGRPLYRGPNTSGLVAYRAEQASKSRAGRRLSGLQRFEARMGRDPGRPAVTGPAQRRYCSVCTAVAGADRYHPREAACPRGGTERPKARARAANNVPLVRSGGLHDLR